MEFNKVIELLNELTEAKENSELEWELTGNTRYETNWNGQDIVVDRRNNIDINSQEIYIKVAAFEEAYLPNTDEFNFLGNYIESIQCNN
ncbi:hypothetical protein [Tenacibaculum singaporense]|uniref:hypothetical protein n=1 Tax=Tenacibaculum singaporense TaxID=2358479 RepID=UPI00351119EC